MKELYIYCAGGAGREIRMIAERKNARHSCWSAIHFVDDVLVPSDATILSYVDFLSLHRPAGMVEFLIGNGEPVHRETLRKKICADGYQLATLVDDTVVVAPNIVVESGVIIYPYTCVSPNVEIKENTLIYYNCNIAHDSIIGKDTVISMSVCICGHCKVGSYCFLGANSVVKEHVTVGDGCILGAGGVLLHDASNLCVYCGVPAKCIKQNKTKRVFS